MLRTVAPTPAQTHRDRTVTRRLARGSDVAAKNPGPESQSGFPRKRLVPQLAGRADPLVQQNRREGADFGEARPGVCRTGNGVEVVDVQAGYSPTTEDHSGQHCGAASAQPHTAPLGVHPDPLDLPD